MQEIFSRPLSYPRNDNLRASEHPLCNIACIIHAATAAINRREGTLINGHIKSFINGAASFSNNRSRQTPHRVAQVRAVRD